MSLSNFKDFFFHNTGLILLLAVYLSILSSYGLVFWITILQVLWYIYDRDTRKRGGRPIAAVKRFSYWKKLAGKFPIILEKTALLDPKHKYILGYHPHGAAGVGAVLNFATDSTGFSQLFPGITPHLLSHSTLHFIPILKEILAVFGIGDVSKESIRYVLKDKGHLAVIVVGGAKEALMTHSMKNYIVLKNRKGFVKMAIITGSDLVPAYSFGENQIWPVRWRVLPGQKLNIWQKMYMKLCGYPPLMPNGRSWLNLPFLLPIYTIVGKPIQVIQNDHPSLEMIDEVHMRYMNDLIKLFEDHKFRFGMSSSSLTFVD